jgi:hypothetical protein
MNDKGKYSYNYLISKGLTPVAAAGIVGNLVAESGLDTKIKGTADDKDSVGIAQWHSERKEGLMNFAKNQGKNYDSLNVQLDYILHELQQPQYKDTFYNLQSAKTPTESTNIFMNSYEKPAEWAKKQSIGLRLGSANEIFTGKPYENVDYIGNDYTGTAVGYEGLTPEQQAYFDAYVSQYNNIKEAEKSKEDSEAEKAKAAITQKQQEQAFLEEYKKRTEQAPQRKQEEQAPQFDGSAYRLEQQQMPTIQYAQLPVTEYKSGGYAVTTNQDIKITPHYQMGGKKRESSEYIDITKKYGIPQFTEEYINKAMELNKLYPGSKFVCTANGCADIASQAASGMGHNFGKSNAWEYGNKSDILFTNPSYKEDLKDHSGPLHNPTSYDVPKEFLGMNNVLIGLNRNNNLIDSKGKKLSNSPNSQQIAAAKNRKEANDSYDYANQDLYKGSRGYEHIGYMVGDNTLLHGTAANKDHPAFFVLDDITDGINLAGYGKYEPVEAISEPTIYQNFTGKLKSLRSKAERALFKNPTSSKTTRPISKYKMGGYISQYENTGEIEGRKYNSNKKKRANIGYFAEGGIQYTDEYGNYTKEEETKPPKEKDIVRIVTIQDKDGSTRKVRTDSEEYINLYKSGNIQTGTISENENRNDWFGGGLEQVNIINNSKKKGVVNPDGTPNSGKFPSLESQGVLKKIDIENILRTEANEATTVKETIPEFNKSKTEAQINNIKAKQKDRLELKTPEQLLAEIKAKESDKTKNKQEFKVDINNITEDDYNNLPQEQKNIINDQLKKNNLITAIYPGSTKEQIKSTQKLLVEKGYDLGKYGVDKNGIDGIYGPKTTKALEDYNKKVDSEQAYSLIRKYNQENFLKKAPDNPNFFYINSDDGIKDVQTNYQKMGYLNPEIKNFDLNFDEKNLKTSPKIFSNSFIKSYSKDTCEYGKECATFVTSDVLNSMKSVFGGSAEQKFKESNVRGDAWTMDKNIIDAGGKTMYSVFGENKPKLQENTGSIKRYIQEKLANRPKVDISKLKEGDIVSMYYDKSPNFIKAYKESSKTFTTHIGILKKDKNNNLYVEHNVHGKIFRNPISEALKGTNAGNSKIQISAITRPKYNLEDLNSIVDTKSTSSNQAVNYDKVKNPNSPFIKGNLPVFQEAITRNKKVILKDVPINEREFNNLEKAATSIAWKESYGNQNVDDTGLTTVKGAKKLLGTIGENLGLKELSRGFTQLKDEKNLNSNLRNRILQNDKDLSDPKKSAIASFYSLASKYLYLRDLSKKNSIKMSDSDLTKLSMLSWNEDIKVVGDSIVKYKNYDDVMNAYRTDKKTNTITGHPYDKAISFFENNFKIE